MRPNLRTVLLACTCTVSAFACHNQSTDNDTGQAVQGKNPDMIATPPAPVVASSAGPASSVAAVNLTRTVVDGPPNHDGPSVCHVEVGNAGIDGRRVTTQNTGNVAITKCDAVVYVYDANHKQLARMDVPGFKADGGTAALTPRASQWALLPTDQATARDANDWFVPVVTHVEFADGQSWNAPADRAPAHRPFEDVTKPQVAN